jgi:flagella basal body P-ring formation protein FlgA
MSARAAGVIIIVCLVTSAHFCQGSSNSQADDPSTELRAGLQKNAAPFGELSGALEIYLPREITINDDYLRLGQVAIIRLLPQGDQPPCSGSGDPGDDSLAAKAGSILLGRFSVPGQKVIVERSIILSRLACNGIPAQKVTLTGAKTVTVKQQQQIIKGERFVELAKSFLRDPALRESENNPPAGSALTPAFAGVTSFLRKQELSNASACQWEPVRIPPDLILAGPSKDVKFSPQLIETGQTNQAKVRIVVVADGKELATREVALRFKYNSRRAVTLAQIAAGTVITAENVKIESVVCDYPEPANWRPPYGLVARRRLPANTVIDADTLDAAKTAVRIGRNESVVIRFQMPGLVVTAMGKTLQDGRVGEHIKVRNLDSQRMILCRVNEDGTVEPIL